MVNVAGAVNRGYGFATEQDRLREEQGFRRAEEEQNVINRGRQNAARDAMVDEYGVMAGDPVGLGQMAGITQRQTAFDRGIEDDDATRRTQAIQNASNMYLQALQRGASPEEAAATIGRVIPLISPDEESAADALELLSTDPSQAEAVFATLSGQGSQRQVFQQEIIRQPDGSTAMRVTFRDGTSEVQPIDGEPLNAELARDRLAQGERRLGQQWHTQFLPSRQGGVQGFMGEDGMVNQAATPGGTVERDFADQDRTRRQSLENLNRQGALAIREAQTAIDLINDTESFQHHHTGRAGQRIAASRVPGTAEHDVRRAIQAFMDNVGINELLNIKREGSGLGHVPQQQLVTLQSLLGRLEMGRDPDLLLRDLEQAIQIYEHIMSGPSEELTALGGTALNLSTTREGGQRQPSADPDDLNARLNRYAPE